MQSVKELFGKRIKELRKAKHLTQEQLAELVDIDTRNIIKIENSETFPRVKTLDKLLEVFDVTPSEIFQTSHLENTDILRRKISEKLKDNDELTRLIYKMLF